MAKGEDRNGVFGGTTEAAASNLKLPTARILVI